MAKSNKFGTFGGVFTPSILTILGVIMFLRLPMIVGQAGIWATLGIIVIAHIISITTGLSVSSIATDKKVKAGGTYYIISRSLGLPIGGTLGLALFVGLSFSVSLYLIGFAESFLGFWGFPVNIGNIRLAGSLILFTVTIITFISTSLAIKSQYLIMAAISLALLSVFFGNHEFAPAGANLFNKGSTVPLMVLFGIFFPAVTGFEAGVSMSGDLKDPKKSIPVGTIAAIILGLIVYIGLIFFLGHTVQADALANDPDILLKISRVPQLVVAGIWGATLSSALGSILAAPRILQATAIDKITPKFFAKGTVSANEPRNALLLTFLIAESGIMIGDLNVIARIVSIFFITTYGFLNLSAAFEAATSADFRPSFRAPAWVSLIGAAACILVMIQLDFLALIGATIILGLLFLFIKRKQLSLEGGDAWSSVWASLVKTGIKRLNKIHVQARNWRPNIIMFAGNETERPYLVEMGNSLTGTLGMITGFELEVMNEAQVENQYPRMNWETDQKDLNYYKHSCPDICSGMDEIVRVYGFTGVEPNTVLMGWSRKTDRRDQFERLVAIFDRNNIGSIFLNYDRARRFGNYKTIDIWWKGSDRNLVFAINIIRHITSSGDWKDAKVRLLAVINHKTLIEKAHKILNETIDRYRVNMEVMVIDNSIDGYSWEDIVKKESAETDLTILGFSSQAHEQFEHVYNEVNTLKQTLGSLLLIKAGHQFEEVSLGIDAPQIGLQDAADLPLVLPQLILTKYQVINDDIAKIDFNGQKVLEKLYEKAFLPSLTESHNFINELKPLIGSITENLDKLLKYNDLHRRNRALVKTKNEFYYHSKRILEKLLNEKLTIQKNAFEDGISWYIDRLEQDLLKFPHHLAVNYDKTDFKIRRADNAALRWYKTRKKILHPFARTSIPVKIRYKNVAGHYLRSTRYFFLHELLDKFSGELEAVFSGLRPLFISVDEQLGVIERKINAKEFSRAGIQEIEKQFVEKISGFESEISGLKELSRKRLFAEYRKNLQLLINDLERIDTDRIVSKKRGSKRSDKSVLLRISSFSELWYNNSSNYFNKIYLDLSMQSYKNRIKDKFGEFENVFIQEIELGLLKELAEIKNNLGRISEDLSAIQGLKLSIISAEDHFHLISGFETITAEFGILENDLPETLSLAETTITGNKLENSDNVEVITLPIRKITGYVLETRLIGSVNDLLGKTMESLQGSIYILNDLLSLARFNLENISSETEDRPDIIDHIRDETLARLTKEEEKIIGLKHSLIPAMSKKLDETFDTLSSYKVKDRVEEYSRFSIDYQGRLVKSKFKLSYLFIKDLIKRKWARLLYSRSEGILLARQLISDKDPSSKNEGILDLIDTVVPRPEVIKALPHYYKNLFSGKSSITDDFWISMTTEEAQFEKAIKRFHTGVKGGIMLLGERNAGKTTLCKYVTRLHLNEDKVHHIFPVPGGSVLKEDFLAQLQKSTGLTTGIHEIIDTLPYGSVLVIHDLELWWERSEQGLEIIKLILDLIGTFNFKCLFIINMNPFTYDLINGICTMDSHFISIIYCQPFISEELKEMVLRRHRSSGLKFRVQKREEEHISEIALARLFNRYFDQSDGNPGTVLYQWLANIEKVTAGTIYIGVPKNIDIQPIENLDEDSLVVLVQLALHKRMPYGKLEKILGIESHFTQEIVNSLIRTGLIEERPDGLLLINPYVEPLVRKVIKRKGLV